MEKKQTLEIGKKLVSYVKYLCSGCSVGIIQSRCRTLAVVAALKIQGEHHIFLIGKERSMVNLGRKAIK